MDGDSGDEEDGEGLIPVLMDLGIEAVGAALVANGPGIN